LVAIFAHVSVGSPDGDSPDVDQTIEPFRLDDHQA
jgi:hypothetical protein